MLFDCKRYPHCMIKCLQFRAAAILHDRMSFDCERQPRCMNNVCVWCVVVVVAAVVLVCVWRGGGSACPCVSRSSQAVPSRSRREGRGGTEMGEDGVGGSRVGPGRVQGWVFCRPGRCSRFFRGARRLRPKSLFKTLGSRPSLFIQGLGFIQSQFVLFCFASGLGPPYAFLTTFLVAHRQVNSVFVVPWGYLS